MTTTGKQPLESPWEEVNRVMEGAAKIEALTRLYREGGRTPAEALEMAIETWKRDKENR